MTWQEQYLKRFYDRDRGWLDGTTEFWRLCEREIAPGSRVLEIGAGPSNRTSRFLASIGCLDCVDEDPVVLSNDALGHKLILERGRIPMPNGSYDACVSNYVLEHLRNPREHLCEVRRVLKPGGAYIFRTPNRWHYVALVAQGTPHWVHQIMANRLRGLSPEEHDPYPTYYRFNSRKAITSASKEVGLTVRDLYFIEKEPSYGKSSPILFLTFMAYERIVNSMDGLAALRCNILGVLTNPRE
jgi:SAM-dependent methyltransferase